MANKTGKAVFRWLHVSDLHIASKDDGFWNYVFDGNPRSHDQNEKKGMRGILSEKGGVDCIVATGDYFHKGQLNLENKRIVQAIIDKIYDACKTVSNWKDTKTKERLCFCPGNHDLDRMAWCADDNNHPLNRLDCIKAVAEKRLANLDIDDNKSKQIIVLQSFKCFYEAMQLSDRTDVKIFGDGQIICISPSARSSNFEPKVVFIGLNTALLAGQQEKSDSDHNLHLRAEDCINGIASKLGERDYVGAKESFKAAYDAFEEANNDKINDYGKMCLPDKESMEQLEKFFSELKSLNMTVIPILFGHHSSVFFNSKAKNELFSLIQKYHIPIYLCGHSHQLSDMPIVSNSFSRLFNPDCLEVTVGGLFYDIEKYNQISFSVGTIEWDKSTGLGKVFFTIDYYMCLYTNQNGEIIGNWMHAQSKWPPQTYYETSNVTVHRFLHDESREKTPEPIGYDEKKTKIHFEVSKQEESFEQQERKLPEESRFDSSKQRQNKPNGLPMEDYPDDFSMPRINDMPR